jgi:ATP-binding cassette subfamily C (CFTR/MRP) protein 1
MAVEFLAALCIIPVSLLEHSRAPRPSILLNIYLFLTTIIDMVRGRTLWLASVNPHEVTISRLFTATVVLKAVILLLESSSKTRWIQWDMKKHSAERTSGIFSLATFGWLNQVFLLGYKNIMTLDDLFPLDQGMSTAVLQLRLTAQLASSSNKKGRHNLAKGMARALAIPLLFPVAPRIALIAFRFCQPFLINTLLDFLQKPVEISPKDTGWVLIIATVLIYTGLAISTALYRYFQERAICMSRGMLAGMVYSKTTESEHSAVGDSAALTLMSIDVERIRLGLMDLHELWANLIEVGFASWLLQRQLGKAVAAPLIVALCCFLGGGFANRYTGERQKSWMDKIEKRVGLTADVIASMKNLKISGITAPVEDLIQNMRVEELESASRFRTIWIIVVMLGYTPMAISPVITFAVTSRTLDTTTIFTSLSYLILLADPLGYLFQNAPNILAAFACLERIQVFLQKEGRIDFRTSHEDEEDKSGSVMNIANGKFGWKNEKASLKNINLKIPISGLTIVVGPVASGKTTLCKVLLGEIPVSEGQVSLNASFASRSVGYCDQTPYLSNATIRENIVGFSHFDPIRYTEVIQATILMPDLCILPQGDNTKIGSNGITLSGGQRQRVSMARALYLNSDFLVFDDILSGLDADTEDQVFRRVFGPEGLIRQRNATALLCTHNIQHLPHSDHIVALGSEGEVVEQGSMQTLLADPKYVHSLGVRIIHNESPIGVAADWADQGSRPSNLNELAPTESYIDTKSRMMGDSTVYRYYLASLGKRSIIAFVVFGLGWGFFYSWGNIWLNYWSEDLSSEHPRRSNSFYIGLYAVYQITYLASLFFCYLVCYRTMIQVSGSKLHKSALSTVFNAPLKFFTTTDNGLITNLFSQDMNLIDDELPIAVTNIAVDICNALGMAAVIASSSPFLAIGYPFIFIILFGIQKVYLRTSRQLRFLDLESKGPL